MVDGLLEALERVDGGDQALELRLLHEIEGEVERAPPVMSTSVP